MKNMKHLLSIVLVSVMLAVLFVPFSCAGGGDIYAKPAKPGARYKYEKEFDLTDYVNAVTERYDYVRDLVHNNKSVVTRNISDSVKLRIYERHPIRLEIKKGFDDLNYTRLFTFGENDELVFCYYENDDEAYRMYFYNDQLVKVTYYNKVLDTTYDARMEDAQNEFYDWGSFALYEAYYYSNATWY